MERCRQHAVWVDGATRDHDGVSDTRMTCDVTANSDECGVVTKSDRYENCKSVADESVNAILRKIVNVRDDVGKKEKIQRKRNGIHLIT